MDRLTIRVAYLFLIWNKLKHVRFFLHKKLRKFKEINSKRRVDDKGKGGMKFYNIK